MFGKVGRKFARAIFKVLTGDWTGPIESGYGLHLVRVHDHTPGRHARIEEVKQAVLRDFVEEVRRKAKTAAYKNMRSRYRNVIETGAGPQPLPERHRDRRRSAAVEGEGLMGRLTALLMVLVAVLLSAAPPSADDTRPAFLEINEQTKGRYQVVWKRPIKGNRTIAIAPNIAPACRTAPLRSRAIVGAVASQNRRSSRLPCQ